MTAATFFCALSPSHPPQLLIKSSYSRIHGFPASHIHSTMDRIPAPRAYNRSSVSSTHNQSKSRRKARRKYVGLCNKWILNWRDTTRNTWCAPSEPPSARSLITHLAGRRAILPAALTAAPACAALQFAWNEVQIRRLDRVTDKIHQQNSPQPEERNVLVHLLKWIGVTEYTDEQHIAKLSRQREAYLRRIAVLEEQVRQAKEAEK